MKGDEIIWFGIIGFFLYFCFVIFPKWVKEGEEKLKESSAKAQQDEDMRLEMSQSYLDWKTGKLDEYSEEE